MNLHPEDDGITHINIYSKGRTELGRMLSNFAHTHFRSPIDGWFASVEGYWYWLGIEAGKGERLRGLHGFRAKQEGRALLKRFPRPEPLDDEAFRNRIMIALYKKLVEHPGIRERLVKSTLPFAHYYVFNGAVKAAGYEWITAFWERARVYYKNH